MRGLWGSIQRILSELFRDMPVAAQTMQLKQVLVVGVRMGLSGDADACPILYFSESGDLVSILQSRLIAPLVPMIHLLTMCPVLSK